MSGKNALFLCALLGFVVLARGIPLESSTTVKFLVPSPDIGDEDDAIVIEGGDKSPEEVPEMEFNSTDCLLPKSKGPCRAVIDSWYYSIVTKSCEPFAWSGCGGNNNRFSEKAFCQTHCSKDKLTGGIHNSKQDGTTASASTASDGSMILFPGERVGAGNASNCPHFDGCGPLKCAVTTDPVTGCQKCECSPTNTTQGSTKTSKNTGAGTNVPESKDDQGKLPIGSVSGNPDIGTSDVDGAKKPEKPEDVCHLPETRGDCRAMITRWRYDPVTKACLQFHFGGCDGNSNNFVNQDKCEAFCKGQ